MFLRVAILGLLGAGVLFVAMTSQKPAITCHCPPPPLPVTEPFLPDCQRELAYAQDKILSVNNHLRELHAKLTAPKVELRPTIGLFLPLINYYGEQMSQQTFAQMELLYITKHYLHRDFMEPVFAATPRDIWQFELDFKSNIFNAPLHLLEPFAAPSSTFWDLEKLSAYHPLVPYSRLIARDRILDQLIIFYDTGEVLTDKDGKSRCRPGPAFLEFWGQEWLIKRIDCQLVPPRGVDSYTRALKSLIQPDALVVGVSVRRGRTGDTPYYPQFWDDYFEMRKGQVANQEISQYANQLIERWFGKEPFLGVHWRRGDRGHAEMANWGRCYWEWSQPGQISNRLCEILQERNIRHVFIATNSGSPEDRARVLATTCIGFKPDIHYLPEDVYPYNKTHTRDELKRMMTEMHINIQATAFLSSGMGANQFYSAATPGRTTMEHILMQRLNTTKLGEKRDHPDLYYLHGGC
jgi:hypothetical protein